MNVDGTEVSLLMKEGEPDCLVGVQFVVSPKAGFMREARELAKACAAPTVRLGIALDGVEGRGKRRQRLTRQAGAIQ